MNLNQILWCGILSLFFKNLETHPFYRSTLFTDKTSDPTLFTNEISFTRGGGALEWQERVSGSSMDSQKAP